MHRTRSAFAPARATLPAALVLPSLLLGCPQPVDPRADTSAVDASEASTTLDAGAEVSARPDADHDAELSPDAAARPLTFGACEPGIAVTAARVECARADLPLDHARPAGEQINVQVYRVRRDAPDGRALWILLGGPGQAGRGGLGLAGVLLARDPALTVYLADHRGTGESARLECPEQESPGSPGGAGIAPPEWEPCRDAVVAAHGAALAHYSATAAARDFDALIARTRAPGERVFVMGVSYGTFLLNRLLLVGREPLEGAVFDSLCAPGHCYLSEQDQWEDRVARQILARCGADAACAARFAGGDAVAALTDLHRRVAAGFCPIGSPAADPGVLRSLMGVMMFSAALRRATPAVIHRWSRCNADDQRALTHLVGQVLGGGGGGMPNPALAGWSFVLGVNIAASEMWEPSNPSLAELQTRWQATLAARGVSFSNGFGATIWPRYADPLATQLATTTVPVLAMNAEFDPATPVEVARPLGMRFAGPHQRYVEIPHAAHGVTSQGQLASRPDSTCGRELLLQFVRDPRAPLDTACLADTVPLAFTIPAGLTMQLFGTTSLWGE